MIVLQFHLKTKPQSAQDIVANCREELIPTRCVQTKDDILAAGNEKYQSINQVMQSVLAFLQRGSG